jgi:hypothetical protein
VAAVASDPVNVKVLMRRWKGARNEAARHRAVQDLLEMVDALRQRADAVRLQSLLELPEDESLAPVVEASVVALAEIGAPAVDELTQIVDDGEEPASSRAADALSRMGTDEWTAGLIGVLSGRSLNLAKRHATRALVAIGTPAVDGLMAAFADPVARLHAAVALKAIGDARGLALLDQAGKEWLKEDLLRVAVRGLVRSIIALMALALPLTLLLVYAWEHPGMSLPYGSKTIEVLLLVASGFDILLLIDRAATTLSRKTRALEDFHVPLLRNRGRTPRFVARIRRSETAQGESRHT